MYPKLAIEGLHAVSFVHNIGWDEINAREYYSKLTVNVSIFRYQYQEYVRR